MPRDRTRVPARRGGADPEPDPGVPDVPPRSDPPDLAVQVFVCLEDYPLLEPKDGNRIRDDLIAQLEQFSPGADVRTSCVDGSESIGLWREPVPNDEHVAVRHQRRDEALEAVDILEQGEHLAFQLTTNLVRARAREEWRRVAKRYTTGGSPKPDGPVRLRYLRLGFPRANFVTTTVGVQWRRIKFRIRVEDALSLTHGLQQLPVCDSKVKIRSRAVSWGLAFAKPILGFLFPHRRVDVNGAAEGRGAGCATVAQLPHQFLIPGLDTKFEVSYQRLTFDRDALRAAGTLRLAGRRPEVHIDGPPQLGAEMPQGIYRATTVDMRAPSFVWTSDGDVSSHTGDRTFVRFTSAPGATQEVRVTASDVDPHVEARATLTVRVAGRPGRSGGAKRPRLPGRPRRPARP